MEPMVRETVNNIFHLGTVRALTGPIARGDQEVVRRHRAALQEWNPSVEAIYMHLGRVAIDLAKKQGDPDERNLQALSEDLLIPLEFH